MPAPQFPCPEVDSWPEQWSGSQQELHGGGRLPQLGTGQWAAQPAIAQVQVGSPSPTDLSPQERRPFSQSGIQTGGTVSV